jgi:galactose mutarotase-like enzyme
MLTQSDRLSQVINLTNHGYWNISGDLKESAKTHTVQLLCSKYAVVNENLVCFFSQKSQFPTSAVLLTPNR